MTQIKICGFKETAHALAAIEAGANFIGLIFAPSPRQVTTAQASKIASAIKEYNSTIDLVGVFVNLPAPEVNRIAHSCNLDWVELCGDETWEYCLEINEPIIKAFRIRLGQLPEEICNLMATGDRMLSGEKHRYTLDSQVKGKYGGTGITFNWDLARQVARQFPIIIAGGLTPENVAQAIEIVAPWGVDVASGVESNEVKDITKIKAFIEAVRRADASKR